MSFALRTGLNYAQFSQEYVYDPIKGPQTITNYEASIDGVNALLNQLRPYQRISISGADPPKYTVSITTPENPDGSNTQTTIWEVLVNYKEQDIYEWAASIGVSQDDVIGIQNFVRKPVQGGSPSISTDPKAAILWNLVQYRHLKRAMEDIVFRYQYVISNSIQTVMAYSRRDTLFSHAQLLDPSFSGLVIPAPTIASLNAAYAAVPVGIAPNFAWSWLKRCPTSRQTQIGKVVITGEYWLQAWSLFEYPIAA
jgi:hypothetical protein